MLDLSKIEAGKMTLFLETFEPARTVREVAATFQPLVGKNGNRLEIDCPADLGTMRADQTKVRQILFNLLSNATKFTEKGVIRLEVKLSTFNLHLQPSASASRTGIGMSRNRSAASSDLYQAEASDSEIRRHRPRPRDQQDLLR
jgi:signal transduction histidine kinase